MRSICAPWKRGDFSSAEWADPEIDYVLVDGPSPGRWTGQAAMGEAFRGVLNAYAEYHIAAEEFRVLDDERVLVLHRYSGRGKTSGLEIGQIASRGADLFHVTDGKVTRLVLYWELDRALADLGLAPEPDATGPAEPPAPHRLEPKAVTDRSPLGCLQPPLGEGLPLFGIRQNETPTAVNCHGTAALVDLTLSDGSYLVEGKTVTGFANSEEEFSDSFVGLKVMPWRYHR